MRLHMHHQEFSGVPGSTRTLQHMLKQLQPPPPQESDSSVSFFCVAQCRTSVPDVAESDASARTCATSGWRSQWPSPKLSTTAHSARSRRGRALGGQESLRILARRMRAWRCLRGSLAAGRRWTRRSWPPQGQSAWTLPPSPSFSPRA